MLEIYEFNTSFVEFMVEKCFFNLSISSLTIICVIYVLYPAEAKCVKDVDGLLVYCSVFDLFC